MQVGEAFFLNQADYKNFFVQVYILFNVLII
jgi:hypothetical protein